MYKQILMALLVCVALTGCSGKYNSHDENQNNRFYKVYEQGTDFTTYYAVIIDKETGHKYLMIDAGYGAGLTKL